LPLLKFQPSYIGVFNLDDWHHCSKICCQRI